MSADKQDRRGVEDEEPIPTPTLICAECGSTTEPVAIGWKGFLDEDRFAVFCPHCGGEFRN